ncbi:MAG: YdcF family protein [Candidatus Competibacteraceae bacterium]|nr:YdcF family protein [Candidatus Competibacteraceae bacterium]
MTKILAQLVYPLTQSLVLSIVAGLLFWRRRHRLGGLCLAVSLSWLWLCATPAFSDFLRAPLERTYLPVPIADLPSADAIVILGGGMQPASPPYRLTFDLGSAADRIWYGAQLYKAGKANRILATGGGLPWFGSGQPEAPAIVQFLADLGVPESVVLLETTSMNTHQNALYSKPLLHEEGLDSVLLVTSALHMPRALATFRAQGIQAQPAPTDFEVVPVAEQTILRWLPDAEALADTTRGLREYFGLLVYRMLEWS